MILDKNTINAVVKVLEAEYQQALNEYKKFGKQRDGLGSYKMVHNPMKNFKASEVSELWEHTHIYLKGAINKIREMGNAPEAADLSSVTDDLAKLDLYIKENYGDVIGTLEEDYKAGMAAIQIMEAMKKATKK